jgi:glycosyltransferase involved in cell wall biosynthesis
LLKECDIYVHPAYAEGFGISVAEAMMAGKPIIVSDAGALPEVIGKETEAGLIINPFDAKMWADTILSLIHDRELSKSLGDNAKIRAENEFTIEKYFNNYKNFYLSLIESK